MLQIGFGDTVQRFRRVDRVVGHAHEHHPSFGIGHRFSDGPGYSMAELGARRFMLHAARWRLFLFHAKETLKRETPITVIAASRYGNAARPVSGGWLKSNSNVVFRATS